MRKKDFFPFKMKFSIQEEGKEKQIFFTFKEASEKTGIPSKTILRVLKSGRNKYFRRSDKKLFGFRMKRHFHLFRLMEKIFLPRRKSRRDLEFLEQFCLTNFVKRKTHFLDSQEKSHEVTWKSDDLEKFISLLKEAKMGGDVAMAICRGKRKANKKVFAEIEEEALSFIEDTEREF